MNYLLHLILCAYNVFNNPKGFTKRLLNISWVLIYYNLPANPFILRDISNASPYPYMFRWTLVCIRLDRFLNLEREFFLNRAEPSMVLKRNWYYIMYTVILFRDAYFIRLVINSGHYFNRDITKH